jgi:hypothetical protein
MILRESYRRRLQELAGIVSESKQSESMGLAMLSGRSIPQAEDIVSGFAGMDRSKNQKNIPVMAFLYGRGSTDTKAIADVVNEYNDLEEKKRIKPIQLSKTSLKIGDSELNEFLKFAEYVHAVASAKSSDKKSSNVAADFKSEKKPMWSGNNIDIYEGDSVGKCIAYTQGGLTDKSYSFCIGQPGNSMYKSYRDSQESSFYFIVDRNRFKENADGSVNLDDPLHIVVFDQTRYGIELTDADNTTGTIAEFGRDAEKYVGYLKSKGVPVEKLVNRPKTEQEKYEDNIFVRKNTDLEWFKNLDNPYNPDYRKPDLKPGETAQNYYKSAYIGRGNVLSDEQFDYLLAGAK